MYIYCLGIQMENPPQITEQVKVATAKTKPWHCVMSVGDVLQALQKRADPERPNRILNLIEFR